jgi:hypothetical protein
MRVLPLAALLVAPATIALAGPPYATDDPVPTERDHWEIYPFIAGSHVRGESSGEGGLDLNYGGGDDLQLTLVLPAAWERTGDTHVGAGTVELAAKARVIRQESGAPVDLAVFPRILLPTAGHGLGGDHASVLLPMWIGHQSGAWDFFGGGGYLYAPSAGDRSFWSWGAALTRAVRGDVTIGAELYGRGADAPDGRSFVGADIGATWQLAPHWAVLGSCGPGLVHGASEGRFSFYVALLFTR